MSEPRFVGVSVGGTLILRELEPNEELPPYAPDLSGVARVLQAQREAFLDHAMGPDWRDKAKALGAAAITSTKKQDDESNAR